MRTKGVGFLAAAVALTFATSALAEMFNCHQRAGQVLYSYSGSPGQYGGRTSSSRSYSTTSYSSRTRYQQQASYSGSRHYWNDRGRW